MVARNDPDFDPRESDFCFGSKATVKASVARRPIYYR